VSSLNQATPASRAAAFIAARVFVEDDGQCTTDSSLLYELVELARQFDEFSLHCFVIQGERTRDTLQMPASVRLVDLGRVTCGRDLYGHPLRLWRRIRVAVRHGRWAQVVLVDPRLTSLFALVACGLARQPAIALIRGDPAATAVAHRYSQGPRAAIGAVLRHLGMLTERVLASAVTVVTDSDVVRHRLEQRGATVLHVAAASISKADVMPPGQPWSGPGDGPMRLLFVGRLERVKDIGTLLEAVLQAAGAGREFLLQIVGSGDPDYTGQMRALALRLGLADRVRFVGSVPHGKQLYLCYQRAHALVMSSLSEGIPKVIIEAMAHGLPVVATRVGGIARLVTPRVGILVPPADPAALSLALATMHDSPTLAKGMSSAAREAAACLLAEPVSRQLASVLAESSRPPRACVRALLRKGARGGPEDSHATRQA
jgi:glycosyltransferase involved in cell wall biosynthesis